MNPVRQTLSLSHAGAMAALAAAVAKAEEIGIPQNIVIVDTSGVFLAGIRMDGAKYLSIDTATGKARFSASHNAPSGHQAFETSVTFGLATKGGTANLPGGLPIRFDGVLVGGIGVGSGTGDQDLDVARAALTAIGADQI
ncbi:glc operon protein GlcG [Rhizobium sp. SG_E_25_P2]|uniref:GlcG/HbpS family heme-binding protein n=1 Tax=Rhizobium sp. SG_E_25_P2 TaxID=2879942 RepID=UPI0024769951|nr:heme-binding protein [Rhizobium sp. SG_E_25_P2]MDH6266205.1 glc operon protein GlcG [Rhizobium sp. SG_E_25_P2]